MSNMNRLAFIAVMLIFFQFNGDLTFAQQPVHNARISMGYDGAQANGHSFNPNISDNGRYVAFFSDATNLVLNDTNDKTDVFVFDLETEILERVSVASNGEQSNDNPEEDTLADVSDDGRYVVFDSYATNLVENDTNNFCEDWQTHETINCSDVFVKDRLTNEIRLISVNSEGEQGNSGSSLPFISADGRYVAFTSQATNLVEDDTNNNNDVFVYDLQTHQTERVSVASDGGQGDGGAFLSSISGDGRYVNFISSANNLVADDINEGSDIFVRDLLNKETILVTNNSTLIQEDNHSAGLAFISGDGRYVAYSLSYCYDNSGNYVCSGEYMFRYDRQSNETELVSVGFDGSEVNDRSPLGTVSRQGEVLFVSYASNLVNVNNQPCEYCQNVFFRDMDTEQTTLVSKSIFGGYSNGGAWIAFAAADNGERAVFNSTASDLVLGDTNNYSDIFVYGWKTTFVYSVNLPLVFK